MVPWAHGPIARSHARTVAPYARLRNCLNPMFYEFDFGCRRRLRRRRRRRL